jgi:SprT protein
MGQQQMAYVTPETKARVEKRIDEVLALATKSYPKLSTFSRPVVDYMLRGKTGGTANYTQNRISLNSILLNENLDHFIRQTVGHELAHLIAHFVYPNLRQAHGAEWKQVMHFIGLTADRCHSYDTENAAVRQKQKFQYKCGCRTEIVLSSVRHNKIRKGAVYRCNRCAQPLVLVTRLGQVSYKVAATKMAANSAKPPVQAVIVDAPSKKDWVAEVYSGSSKKDRAMVVYHNIIKQHGRIVKEIFVMRCMTLLGMTKAGANTYYYMCKKEA